MTFANLKKTFSGGSPQQQSDNANVSGEGGGRVSVSVSSIISSPDVQRQVELVKEIAASQETSETK